MDNTWCLVGNILTPETGGIRVRALRDLYNEDWKTAVARKQPPMKAGSIGTICEVVNNYYGRFLLVKCDDGQRRYLTGWDMEVVNDGGEEQTA